VVLSEIEDPDETSFDLREGAGRRPQALARSSEDNGEFEPRFTSVNHEHFTLSRNISHLR
jgi:hypothetical protein